MPKFTDEALTEAVSESISVMEVLRRLGCKQGGGSFLHVKRRITALRLDTSHFLGQAANKGKHSSNRQSDIEIVGYVLDRLASSRQRGRFVGLETCHSSRPQRRIPHIPLRVRFQRALAADAQFSSDIEIRVGGQGFPLPNCHSQQETSRPVGLSVKT